MAAAAARALDTKKTFFTKTVVVESAHPYAVNTREEKNVIIPVRGWVYEAWAL